MGALFARQSCFVLALVSVICAGGSGAHFGPRPGSQAPKSDASRAIVFDAVWTTVRDEFFDPNLRGVDWQAMREQYRPAALAAADDDAFANVINQMLDELQTSHTRYFTRQDPRYYQLLGIFRAIPSLSELIERIAKERLDGELSYDGIGIETLTNADGVFVSVVHAGLPAAESGILLGDRIVSADGAPFHPIRSFADKAGQSVRIQIQRDRDGPLREIDVTPVSLVADELCLDVMRNSVRVIEQQGRKVGYMHAFSYAGVAYQDLLREELMTGRLADADALVLDLRDGWGGASPEYLNLFNRQIPVLSMQGRDGEKRPFFTTWRKPTALLINGGVTSGKEVFAFGFKELRRGPIVGTRTAGAVVGGSPRVMPDGSVLYLAVSDAEVNGTRLEGVGVEPTINVQATIPFAAGNDPQLDAAVDALLDEL